MLNDADARRRRKFVEVLRPLTEEKHIQKPLENSVSVTVWGTNPPKFAPAAGFFFAPSPEIPSPEIFKSRAGQGRGPVNQEYESARPYPQIPAILIWCGLCTNNQF